MSDNDVQELNTPDNKREVPRMNADEIADLVRALVNGSVFTGAQCPPDMLASVFMVLGLGGTGDIDPASIGMVYEYMDKAGEMAINGFPMFLSCKFVHKEDWAVVCDRAIAAQEALNRAAAGEK